MNRLSMVLMAMMVALLMASLCSAQEPKNDTLWKIIEGPMIRADESCWIDVHNVHEDGAVGEMVGFSRIGAGIHEKVPILVHDIDPASEGHVNHIDKYLVEIHEDGGEKEKFEPNGPDKVLLKGWLVPEEIIKDPSDKWIMGDGNSIPCPSKGLDGSCERSVGNSWGLKLIEEDEYQNRGGEHPDVPEYPYLAEEDGAFELKGLHFDNN